MALESTKNPIYKLSRSQDEIKLMKGLKQLFDPKNILNPEELSIRQTPGINSAKSYST